MVFEITTAEWQKAKEIQQQLLEASNENARQAILDEISVNSIQLGTLGTAYLPRFHTLITSDPAQSANIGIPGLNHNFIAINDKLYAIDNIDESTRLGAGQFGQVFLGQDENGLECAIKVEPTAKHSANEVKALSAMHYLQASAEIDGKFYTVMDKFPGRSLMHLDKEGKVGDPWKLAAKNLGFNLHNLNVVKKRLDYDAFDDDDFYPSICKIMSTNTTGNVSKFTLADLEQLKESAKALEENNLYTNAERLEFLVLAGEQLKHAFDAQLLHRDIKGDNFVGQMNADKSISVAMVDFGGALSIEDALKTNTAFGSPTYMSPEVIRSLPKDHQLLCFPNKPPKEPEPAAYSTASDLYAFAIMCTEDFGMNDNAGFGVLPFAKATSPDDRPAIEDMLICFKTELACLDANPREKSQIISEFIKNVNSSPTMSEPLKTTVLSALVNKELNEIHDKFSLDYRQVTKGLPQKESVGGPLQSQGFFASKPQGFFSKKPSDVNGVSMKEIAENAAKPHVLHHRKRDVLKENGWLDANNQPTGLLKTLLNCEAELAAKKQTTPILK